MSQPPLSRELAHQVWDVLFYAKPEALDVVRSGLDSGAIPSDGSAIITGEPLLHCAVSKANLAVTKLLLERGANPNLKFAPYDTTPLHALATSRHEDALATANLLIDSGADVNARDSEGRTPIWCAVDHYHNFEMVKLFHARGANINITGPCKIASMRGEITLLSCASFYREIFDWLLQNGADVTMPVPKGCPVQHYFVSQLDRLAQLLDLGADIDAVDLNGDTVLHRAAHWNSADSALCLLARGANVHIENVDRRTPLQLATKKPIIILLVASGADLRKHMITPLIKDHEVQGAKKLIARTKYGLYWQRAMEICVALQPLELPAPLTLQIIDESVRWAHVVELHTKWQLVTAVKHWKPPQ